MGMASGGEDPRVEVAFLELLRAQDRGEAPDPEAWVSARPPEIRTALRAYLRVMGMLKEPSAPTASTVPETLADFGRYSALRMVGRGGMGAVYRADDAVFGRVVALKVMHPELA